MSAKSTPPSPPAGQLPPASGGRAHFFTLFSAIMLPMFLAIVDQTIVAAALPAIAASLGDVELVSWVVVAYLVTTTIAAPVYGRLGDLLGRRNLMFVALAIVIVASILCAISTSTVFLICARALQGFGGGGLMTLSQALIGESLAPRDRARYQGYLAAVAVTSSAFGPVVGGFMTEHLGWRSIFLMNIPLGLLAAMLTLRLPARGGSGEPIRFDFPGLALFATFVVSALVMLQQVQRFELGSVPVIIVLSLAGIAAIVLLIWREKRAPDPLLPLPLFRNPTIWRSDALAACHGAMLVSLMTFVPIYLRVVHGASPAEIGLMVLPMTAAIGLGSLVTGRIVSRTGRTAIFPSGGLAVVVLVLITMAIILPWLSAHEFSWLLGFGAIFMGTVMGVVQLTVQVAAGSSRLGIAAATVQFSRSLGAALGTAIVGTVLFGMLTIGDAETARLFGTILQEGRDVLASLPDAQRRIAQAEISDAFRAAFLVITSFAAGGLWLACSMPLRRV
ncbi:MFS transporter [Paracoccus onubensis]|nr:MFS transporter [Paracoccus onubensis]